MRNRGDVWRELKYKSAIVVASSLSGWPIVMRRGSSKRSCIDLSARRREATLGLTRRRQPLACRRNAHFDERADYREMIFTSSGAARRYHLVAVGGA